jgi:SH3 domain protein
MRLVIGLLSLLPILAAAETGYVTDRLMLGLHQAADTSDRPFRSLESGAEFEILSRDRLYAHVRLADGTEGYVKAAYVVYEPPAKLIVNQAQAEVERLTTELNEAKAAFAEPAAVIDSLKSQAATLESDLDAARTRVEELEEDNARYQSRAERYQYSLPYTWVGGAIGVCLIAGFLGGLWWVDHRSRKRHGGIRIY